MQTRSYPPFRIGCFPNSMLPELTTSRAQRVARPRFPSPTSTPLRTLGPELYDTQQPPPLDLAPPPEFVPNFHEIGASHRSPGAQGFDPAERRSKRRRPAGLAGRLRPPPIVGLEARPAFRGAVERVVLLVVDPRPLRGSLSRAPGGFPGSDG